MRPMNDETQLVNLDTVPPAQLRPEFKKVRGSWRCARSNCKSGGLGQTLDDGRKGPPALSLIACGRLVVWMQW